MTHEPIAVVRAPGKIVISGAYAVLHGAPALVAAVDAYAEARLDVTTDEPAPEIREALGSPAPGVDVARLYAGSRKLGLGSSAAALVAALGADRAKKGADLSDPDMRASIFRHAKDAHSRAQGGGSGVDVAASTYGGILRYALLSGRASVLASGLPHGLSLVVFAGVESARTSELLGQVARFQEAEPGAFDTRMSTLVAASEEVAAAAESASPREFLAAAAAFGDAFDALGDAADLPLVPLAWKRAGVAARAEGATFHPAGAGGGDVGVFLGMSVPSPSFLARAASFGLLPLPLAVDFLGVHLARSPSLDVPSAALAESPSSDAAR